MNVPRGPYRKFGSMQVLRDGRVRLSAWTVPGRLPLDFTALPDDGSRKREIHVHWRSRLIFLLYLTRGRVESACFDYTLTPDELREAVAVLRDAANGLERWIAPALEWNQASSTVKKAHPDTHELIPELLESVRDLPMATEWKRQRRETQRSWAQHLREHPEDRAKVPAPWILLSALPKAPARRPGKEVARKPRATKKRTRDTDRVRPPREPTLKPRPSRRPS